MAYYERSGTALLGLKATASRTLRLARSSKALLGLMGGGFGLMDTWEYQSYGKVYCVYAHGSYLYVITGDNPPTVLKIDISDGSLDDYWVGTGVLNEAASLFIQGIYLYVGGQMTSDIYRGRVVQLTHADMSYVDALDMPDSNDANLVSGIAGDGTYIYFCLQTIYQGEGDYVIGKADPSDMSLLDYYEGDELIGGGAVENCWGIVVSGSYLYVASQGGHVLKMALNDLSTLTDYYRDNLKVYRSIATDGTYVYAGGRDYSPSGYIVSKFSMSDMELADEWTDAYANIYALAYSDSKLYAACKKYCYVLDPSDMSLDTQWESANDDWSSLSVIDNTIYFGQEFTPATVYILGATGLCTRVVNYYRNKMALLGLKTTATKSMALTRSKTALLGLLVTGSRAIALSRSKTALLGLKTTGIMSTAEHYIRTGIAYLGLVVTGTRSLSLARIGTALLGLKGIGNRTIAIARSGVALLGLKAIGSFDLLLLKILAARAYTIEIRNSDGDLVAILENAHTIDYMQEINAPHSLKFELPATDSKVDNILLANEYWLRDNRTGTVIRKFKLQRKRDTR